jgi:hypothetical protein
MSGVGSLEVWSSLGLTDNPYNSLPITSDELGEKLLVGREEELRALTISLLALNTHPTLEGGNGVGKTSLVSVAGYRLFKAYLDSGSRFVLPLQKNFQLSINENVAAFRVKVFLQVVQALISNRNYFHADFPCPEFSSLERWRKSLRSIVGSSEMEGSEPSDGESAGLLDAIDEVKTWLEETFQGSQAGFFLCVIDNLELLETSSDAKALLEEMRDEVLNIPGLRWVLCGARGIVRSVASTGRLVGFLGDPIEILPVRDEYIGALIEARLEAFKGEGNVSAPVEVDGFLKLYHIGHKNLRIAMKYCQDFTVWAFLKGADFSNAEAKLLLLEEWLSKTATKTFQDSAVGKRAWAVFDALAQKGGSVKPSEHPDFGFKSYQAMIPHLQSLSAANLIESVIDNVDARKKTISMLPLGWVVSYERSKRLL